LEFEAKAKEAAEKEAERLKKEIESKERIEREAEYKVSLYLD
jgi:hypothetical protein